MQNLTWGNDVDVHEAIDLLKSAGYTVFKKEVARRFPCSKGHFHMTQEACAKCEKARIPITTHVRLDSVDPILKQQARDRYYNAYRSFQGGRRKADIARDIGISPARADQIIKKGWRWAVKEGWATVVP